MARRGAVAVGGQGWWLPRKGVSGWTAEPRGRHDALRGWTMTWPPADAVGGPRGTAGVDKIAGFLSLFAVRCVFKETCQCLAMIYLPPTLDE